MRAFALVLLGWVAACGRTDLSRVAPAPAPDAGAPVAADADADPPDRWARRWFGRAVLADVRGDDAELARALGWVLRLDGRSVEVRRAVARLHLDRGAVTAAAPHVTWLEARDADAPATRRLAARLATARGDEDAWRRWLGLARSGDASAWPHVARGTDDPAVRDEALAAWSERVRTPSEHEALAAVLERAGRQAEAEAHATWAARRRADAAWGPPPPGVTSRPPP